MITDQEKSTIRESFRQLSERAEESADWFFRSLSARERSCLAMFSHDATWRTQELMGTLEFIVETLAFNESSWRDEIRDQDDLLLTLLDLCDNSPELVDLFDACSDVLCGPLLSMFEWSIGPSFDDASSSAWTRLFTLIAATIRIARARNETSGAILFEGNLSEVELGGLLQVISLGRQCTAIDVFGADGKPFGTLTMKAGRVLCASAGHYTGGRAVHALIIAPLEGRYVAYRAPFSDRFDSIGSLKDFLFCAEPRGKSSLPAPRTSWLRLSRRPDS